MVVLDDPSPNFIEELAGVVVVEDLIIVDALVFLESDGNVTTILSSTSGREIGSSEGEGMGGTLPAGRAGGGRGGVKFGGEMAVREIGRD